MNNLTKLDSCLDKMINLMEMHVDMAVEKKGFNKEFAEAVAIIMSVAYEREKMKDGKQTS